MPQSGVDQAGSIPLRKQTIVFIGVDLQKVRSRAKPYIALMRTCFT